MKLLYKDTIDLVELAGRDHRVNDLLERLKEHHKGSYNHSVNVARLTVDILHDGLPQHYYLVLGVFSGLLHDVGKLYVPIGHLDKPSRLTDEEKDDVDQHVRYGYHLVEDAGLDTVKEIIVAHHEYTDDPYPRTGDDRRKRNREDEQRTHHTLHSDISQCLAVADMTTALLEKRSYKPALTSPEVMEILLQKYRGDPLYRDRVFERLDS